MSDLTWRDDPEAERLLVERAQQGDYLALEELLSAHQDRVFRTALGIVGGNEEAAQEVAQEVLISAFRHIQQFRGASKFSTWLYRMTVNFAKNRAVAYGRRKARFVSLDAPAPGDEEHAPRDHRAEQVSPREAAHGAELMELLHENLGKLTEEYRTVLVLRFIEDVSYEEIATLLAIPVGTVKSRINRARRELRLLMKDHLNPGEDTP